MVYRIENDGGQEKENKEWWGAYKEYRNEGSPVQTLIRWYSLIKGCNIRVKKTNKTI